MNLVAQLRLHSAALVMLALLANWQLSATAHAQQPRAGRQPPAATSAAHAAEDVSLTDQLKQLQRQVAELEAAVEKRYPTTAARTKMMRKDMGKMAEKKSDAGMMGMGGMEGMEGMDRGQMMKMMQMMQMMQSMGGMNGMEGDTTGMTGMKMMGGTGMEMMGRMTKGANGMQMPSALPGFPGASHIYHIGATGFFLDHPEHIELSASQQADVNRIKEKALLEQATTERKIDEAEQQLWTLTASDKPDAAKIDAKVREIEKLRGDQRLAFIRAVGEATQVLTDDQRQALLGHSKTDEPKHTHSDAK